MSCQERSRWTLYGLILAMLSRPKLGRKESASRLYASNTDACALRYLTLLSLGHLGHHDAARCIDGAHATGPAVKEQKQQRHH